MVAEQGAIHGSVVNALGDIDENEEKQETKSLRKPLSGLPEVLLRGRC